MIHIKYTTNDIQQQQCQEKGVIEQMHHVEEDMKLEE
jgi:hypothetical protein